MTNDDGIDREVLKQKIIAACYAETEEAKALNEYYKKNKIFNEWCREQKENPKYDKNGHRLLILPEQRDSPDNPFPYSKIKKRVLKMPKEYELNELHLEKPLRIKRTDCGGFTEYLEKYFDVTMGLFQQQRWKLTPNEQQFYQEFKNFFIKKLKNMEVDGYRYLVIDTHADKSVIKKKLDNFFPKPHKGRKINLKEFLIEPKRINLKSKKATQYEVAEKESAEKKFKRHKEIKEKIVKDMNRGLPFSECLKHIRADI